MFAGIVEELGLIQEISKKGKVKLFKIKASSSFSDVRIGESISVNGVCLTVVNNTNGLLEFEVLAETLKVTNLAGARIYEKVNLERALKISDRISGHFVTGHIDCLGVIRRKYYFQNNYCLDISVPQVYARYLLPKGSIAVDGASLTIAKVVGSGFSVYLIPHTLKNTTLQFKGPSDKVNIEFDILVKKTRS